MISDLQKQLCEQVIWKEKVNHDFPIVFLHHLKHFLQQQKPVSFQFLLPFFCTINLQTPFKSYWNSWIELLDRVRKWISCFFFSFFFFFLQLHSLVLCQNIRMLFNPKSKRNDTCWIMGVYPPPLPKGRLCAFVIVVLLCLPQSPVFVKKKKKKKCRYRHIRNDLLVNVGVRSWRLLCEGERNVGLFWGRVCDGLYCLWMKREREEWSKRKAASLLAHTGLSLQTIHAEQSKEWSD